MSKKERGQKGQSYKRAQRFQDIFKSKINLTKLLKRSICQKSFPLRHCLTRPTFSNNIIPFHHLYNIQTQTQFKQQLMDKLIIVWAVLVAYSMCLNIALDGDEPFCMRYEGGKKYTLQYVVSGVEDQNVRCTITQAKHPILQKELVSEFEFTFEYHADDPLEICFESIDGEEKQVSFDFYEYNDPVRKMIDKKDVTLVQNALSQAYQQMEAISRNQQYQIERDERHKVNLQDSESKIKWAGIVKIVFLLGSALVQLWIMKGFFTEGNPYQPVEQV